jgi:hypothetical protein
MDPCFRQAADSKLTQRRFWLQRRGGGRDRAFAV